MNFQIYALDYSKGDKHCELKGTASGLEARENVITFMFPPMGNSKILKTQAMETD